MEVTEPQLIDVCKSRPEPDDPSESPLRPVREPCSMHQRPSYPLSSLANGLRVASHAASLWARAARA
jgi:hypothetical protein